MLGQEITDAVNLAVHAEKGHLPVAGGVLDQSKWFVAAWDALNADEDKITAEQRQRHE
jgi:hypothetical protein